MIEKHIVLEDVDPVAFYGVNNVHIQMIKALYPKLRIVARGNVIRAMGDEEELAHFEETIQKLEKHCEKYNSLTEEVILAFVNGKPSKQPDENDDVILFSISGRPILPRSANQKKMVQAFSSSDMIFAVGPAGSGKTYTAIALAVRALKNKEIKKIILSRPAVEAGEKLGFLPGDLTQKVDPYLRPLYDAMYDFMGADSYTRLMEKGTVEVAPLAYMRGRTLSDAFIILDEAQNTTSEQMKMFLTRMGFNSRVIVTGDITQTDLPQGKQSGLAEAISLLKGIPGIGIVEMTGKDIVRHELVQKIVEAYEKKHDPA